VGQDKKRPHDGDPTKWGGRGSRKARDPSKARALSRARRPNWRSGPAQVRTPSTRRGPLIDSEQRHTVGQDKEGPHEEQTRAIIVYTTRKTTRAQKVDRPIIATRTKRDKTPSLAQWADREERTQLTSRSAQIKNPSNRRGPWIDRGHHFTARRRSADNRERERAPPVRRPLSVKNGPHGAREDQMVGARRQVAAPQSG
jgi:hypothetical protein